MSSLHVILNIFVLTYINLNITKTTVQKFGVSQRFVLCSLLKVFYDHLQLLNLKYCKTIIWRNIITNNFLIESLIVSFIPVIQSWILYSHYTIWSFRNHSISLSGAHCSSNITTHYQCWNQVFCLIFLWKSFFEEYNFQKNSNLFEIWLSEFFLIIHVLLLFKIVV